MTLLLLGVLIGMALMAGILIGTEKAFERRS